MNTTSTREYAAGIVECRICGLKFLPELEEDRELHQQKHWQILCGALPYEVREFIKRAAWDTLKDDRASAGQKEIAKRAIAFAWWARAMAKGIPSNHFEAFMAAHLAYIDATVSGNREQIAAAEQAIAGWLEFG